MTTQAKVESLIRQAVELPDEAQAELVQSLVEIRSQHLGIYHLDDDERLGRFASNQEIDGMFARHGA